MSEQYHKKYGPHVREVLENIATDVDILVETKSSVTIPRFEF